MCLEVGHGLGIDLRVLVGPLNSAPLADWVWRRDPFAAPIARGTDALDDRVDLSALGLGVSAAHQHHHASAFSHHEAVGLCVEGARSVSRERSNLRELHIAFDAHAGV